MNRAIAISTATLLLYLSSCGGDSFRSNAHRGLSVAFLATNAARTTYAEWDKIHQENLVESSATQEEAVAKVAKYREERKKIVQAFVASYSSIAAASSALALADTPMSELTKLVGDAMEAAVNVKKAIDAIKEIQ